eukprot:3347893-Pyramimonas_sp.AAC.1
MHGTRTSERRQDGCGRAERPPQSGDAVHALSVPLAPGAVRTSPGTASRIAPGQGWARPWGSGYVLQIS